MSEVGAYIVKNTFINVDCPPQEVKPRRCNSLPHLLRLGEAEKDDTPGTPIDSSASTEMRESDDEIASMSSEAKDYLYEWCRSPRSAWEEGDDDEPKSCPAYLGGCGVCAEFPPMPNMPASITALPPGDFSMETPPPDLVAHQEDPPFPVPDSLGYSRKTRLKLNAKASSFQPGVIEESPAMQQYKDDFEAVIQSSKEVLVACEEVAEVQVLAGVQVWTMIIRPLQQDHWQAQHLLEIAKKSLLHAASQSKCIYVMGYAGTKPFVAKPQGFQASLGAMSSPTHACWHVFKKGFCRHAPDCCKQHPACTAPVNVFVDVNPPEVQRAQEFKRQVADLVESVATKLSASAFGAKAEAKLNENTEGWSIDIMVKPEELLSSSEYVLNLAKNAIYSSADCLQSIYLLGYGTQPFIPKPSGFSNGFVATFGDMRDKSCACWDMYSRGSCHREHLCRWQHPEYYMPVNVQVKANS